MDQVMISERGTQSSQAGLDRACRQSQEESVSLSLPQLESPDLICAVVCVVFRFCFADRTWTCPK